MRYVMLALAAVFVVGCGSSSDGGAMSTKAISLPSTLGGYKDILDAVKARHPAASAVQRQTELQDTTRTATEAAYQKAYGGAAVAYREYSDAGLERMAWVIGVRAKSPGMVLGPAQDAKLLELATPMREVKDVGQVQCEVNWNPVTPAGQTPPPKSELVIACQRTGNGLTVFVGGTGNAFTGPDGLHAMAAFANAAWDAVS